MIEQKWEDLSYRSKVAYSTAIISFALGWILIAVNFFLAPIGEVADATLWILGEALSYTGAVVGLTCYAKGEIKKIKHQLNIENEEDTEQ